MDRTKLRWAYDAGAEAMADAVTRAVEIVRNGLEADDKPWTSDEVAATLERQWGAVIKIALLKAQGENPHTLQEMTKEEIKALSRTAKRYSSSSPPKNISGSDA